MGLLQKFRDKKKTRSAYAKGGSNYAYLATRVRAMKSKLQPKETYPRLMNMEIDEIIRFIEETEYKQDVDELARTYEGVDLIEHALNRNLAVTFTKLINISEGESNYLIREYLTKYDIWNIKSILRGKHCDASLHEIKEVLVSAGQFTYTFLSELAAKESYEGVISGLEDTKYYPVLSGYDGTKLYIFENKLDKMYYGELLSTMKNPKAKERKLFVKFIRTEIDVRNLNTLFRLKKAGAKPDVILDLVIDGGFELHMDEIRKLLPLSFNEFIQSLDKYSMWSEISEIVSPDMESLINVETHLTRHSLKSAARLSHAYSLSIVPIMDFILSKENEVNNLRIITRGKAVNLRDEIIREQLVI